MKTHLWHAYSGSATMTRAAQAERDKRTMKNNRLARALLLMLEHEGTNRNNSGAPRWSGKISIEHILPRNISKPGAKWGVHWSSQNQPEWLHRLGNLAMLNDSDNSSLGNCSFQAKIAKIERFKDSASWTIKDLLHHHATNKWDEHNIQERHARLLRILQRWGVEPAAGGCNRLPVPFACCVWCMSAKHAMSPNSCMFEQCNTPKTHAGSI